MNNLQKEEGVIMDREEMLRYAETMPVLIPAAKWYDYEVRADRDWFFVRREFVDNDNKRFKWFEMLPMAELEHVGVADVYELHDSWEFCVITKAGKTLTFRVKNDGWARKLFDLLQQFCAGFRSAECTYTSHTWREGDVDYRVDRNELAAEKTILFGFNRGKKKPYQKSIPTASIVRMAQFSESYENGPDGYFLRLYTADGKHRDIPTGESVGEGYRIALKIRDNNPDVVYTLYGKAGL